MRRWATLNTAARKHAALAALWVLLVIPTILWWSESILWVLMISCYANIVGHWSAFEAARDDSGE
jgi:hypothetical protein